MPSLNIKPMNRVKRHSAAVYQRTQPGKYTTTNNLDYLKELTDLMTASY